ncbi:LLM class flavin-dependent oxidoreductase [Mycolicibacterium boenickei]|nr:LLM class flavin-dependent oxidoreductase [Mycolicibacterium boenickei]
MTGIAPRSLLPLFRARRHRLQGRRVGWDEDYHTVGATLDRKRQRMDEAVLAMRKVWAQEPPIEGHHPVGPAPIQVRGVPLVAGVVGPKALARAAQWADGVSDPAHALYLDAEALAAQRERVAQAWQAAAGPKSRTLNRGASGLLGAVNSAPRRGPDGRRGTALLQHQLSQRPAGVLIATSRTGRGDRAGDRFEPSRRRSRTSRSPSECQGMRELRPEQRADLGQG